MLYAIPSAPSDASADSRSERAAGDDLFVEPVTTRAMSRTTALPPVARIEYLRRLVLEVRVAALEAQLERSRRRRDAVIEHYERLVDEQEGSPEGPAFSWRPR